jgi:hypothetical protein
MDWEAKPQVYMVQAKRHDSYKSLAMKEVQENIFTSCNGFPYM